MAWIVERRYRWEWSLLALRSAIVRYTEARGERPGEAFAAAAEASFWSEVLNDWFRKRHPRRAEYLALRDNCDDGLTVRALALYRHRVVHFIEVPHEAIQAGFSDEFGPEFIPYRHYFLPLDDAHFDPEGERPRTDEAGENLYRHLVADQEIRVVLARVLSWWERCEVEFSSDLEGE